MTDLYTIPQQMVLDAMRERLSKQFGITMQNHTVFLRMDEGSVRLLISDVAPNQMMLSDSCHLCGSSDGLQPAEITLKHANGDKMTYEVLTCGDCRCPQ